MFEAVSFFRSSTSTRRIRMVSNTRIHVISTTGFHSRGPHALDYATPAKTSTTTATAITTGRRTRTEATPNPSSSEEKEEGSSTELNPTVAKTPKKAPSLAEADEELRRRLEEISGEGGASGVETEDGKPTNSRAICRETQKSGTALFTPRRLQLRTGIVFTLGKF
ncbi:uncharacterized protein H6S33_005319 [Morchella sextelata]|uniref:uncharacterized protein n=1 Tax=Morchella sextelata TaxID=1174677 RepID=UPI001D059384|nr:uncharacterized protein H6S33_005319 [Morchella sextelata]KAH0613433.1 hypothetical protein H6S33_005319 [Morchella sextelata]